MFNCEIVTTVKGDSATSHELYRYVNPNNELFIIEGAIDWDNDGSVIGFNSLKCNFMDILGVYYCKDRNHIQVRGTVGKTNSKSLKLLGDPIKHLNFDRIYPIILKNKIECEQLGCLDRNAQIPGSRNGNIIQ